MGKKNNNEPQAASSGPPGPPTNLPIPPTNVPADDHWKLPSRKNIKLAISRERIFLIGSMLLIFTWYLEGCLVAREQKYIDEYKSQVATQIRSLQDLQSTTHYADFYRYGVHGFKSPEDSLMKLLIATRHEAAVIANAIGVAKRMDIDNYDQPSVNDSVIWDAMTVDTLFRMYDLGKLTTFRDYLTNKYNNLKTIDSIDAHEIFQKHYNRLGWYKTVAFILYITGT